MTNSFLNLMANNDNNENSSIFIVISLFLLALIILLLVAQTIIWLVIKLKSSKKSNHETQPYYRLFLKNHQYEDVTVVNKRFVLNFTNYNAKTNSLTLNNNDYHEKTAWNVYRNLTHILLIKWSRDRKKTKRSIMLTIISFYLSVLLILICALIYYISLWTNNLDNINSAALSVFSFIGLVSIVLSWVFWTMVYEKVRKELLELINDELDLQTFKYVKGIIAYKTLFPGGELLI